MTSEKKSRAGTIFFRQWEEFREYPVDTLIMILLSVSLLAICVEIGFRSMMGSSVGIVFSMISLDTLVTVLLAIVGLIFISLKLQRQARHAKNLFEDAMSKEYRQIMGNLPIEAMLGDIIDVQEHLSSFYLYFDLTNEQIVWNNKKKITQHTWVEWEKGIRGNLKLPAFDEAWGIIDSRCPNLFKELRELITLLSNNKDSEK